MFSVDLFPYLIFLYPLEGHLNGLDGSVLIEDELVDAGNSVISIAFLKWATMVDDVVLVLSGHFDDAVMTCATSDTLVSLQNLSLQCKGPEGTVADGISHAIVRTCPSTYSRLGVISWNFCPSSQGTMESRSGLSLQTLQ